jgi:hypothetical protein
MPTKTKTLSIIIITVILGIALYWLSLSDLEKIETEMELNIGKPDSECNTSESFRAKNCSEYLSTEPVTREEWATLFPKADFYWVEIRTIQNFETNMNGYVQNNFIIIKQGQQEYRDDTFGKLLHDNQIIISSENLELVLKAFAWITAANYLNEDISFSALQEVNYTKDEARHPYNYYLSAVTEIDNVKLNWYFVIKNNELKIVTYQSLAPLKDYFFSP